jgi:hypothetical protein
MDWATWLYHLIFDGIAYDVLKALVPPSIITIMLGLAGRQLKWFDNFRDEIVVLGCAFVVVFVALFVVTPHTTAPQLAGKIENVLSGPFDNNRSVIAVASVTLINSGSMQSIAKNWAVSVTVNGVVYQGGFIIPPPPLFTFKVPDPPPGSATAITYHGEENLLDKASLPIPPGGQAAGVLFIIFPNLDVSIFRGGEQYNIRYEDVLSKSYEMRATTSAQRGAITLPSGIHADLMCPAVGPPPSSPPRNYSTPIPGPT